MNAALSDDPGFPSPEDMGPPDVLAPRGVDTSASIGRVAAALAKAQGQISGAVKDSENPFFKSSYADLDSCWKACRRPLSENGLAIFQLPEVTEGSVTVVTILAHSSGEWIRSRLPMKPKDMSPQAIGSTITYARRYALAAMVGIAQTDDDAEAGHGRVEPQHTRKEVTAKAKEYAKRFAAALDVGMDSAVYEIHQEIVGDADFYSEVWGQLPAPMRRDAKERIARAKNGN